VRLSGLVVFGLSARFFDRDVRFGSKADICAAKSHVRSYSKSGHVRCNWGCPLWAKNGLMQCSKKDRYSITSSARQLSVGGIVGVSAFLLKTGCSRRELFNSRSSAAQSLRL
jgi:hypothetical protein